MAAFTELLYTLSAEGIARLTLNRPHAMNALTPTMIKEIRQAGDLFAQDPQAKVLVVTGAGKAWSAGIDLKAAQQQVQEGQFTQQELLHVGWHFIRTLEECGKVSIAEVNGHCYTGALELMLACDVAVASLDAKFADTHAKWGLLPKWGLSQRLPRRVGIVRARTMSFTCQPITAQQAADWGLVSSAVPAEKLTETVDTMARAITKNSSQTIAAIKQLYNVCENTGLKEGLKFEAKFTPGVGDTAQRVSNFAEAKG
eukprot:comp22473_c0_seq1/m.33874 comp22473_c0_seq1/g.33874  ORF comp22473_c0_seq1/g.33874 comp22473_c0_seq1/m.33874 type:complete len:256 (-) comp22473_c0_seq1:82-849(-)